MTAWEEIQSKRGGRYTDYSFMISFGPQNVDQLIAEMLIRKHTIFMESGATDFQEIYDLIKENTDTITQNVYMYLFPKADDTYVDFMRQRPWKHTEDLFEAMSSLAYDGNIKQVLPEQLYKQIHSLTDDDTVVEWVEKRRNRIIQSYIAATSNCCIKQ